METWIKTSEQLPEMRTPVLVFTPADQAMRVAWREPDDYRGHVVWMMLRAHTASWLTYRVSHWMPLPAVPDKDKE